MMRSASLPDAGGNAAHFDAVAAQYDARMSMYPSDVLARQAFVDLVMRQVSAGSTIFDFGCGTGLDAAAYVRGGYHVQAYDHSPGMLAQLEHRCRAEIDAGRIAISSVAYTSFLNGFAGPRAPHAVASNFAVLNLIRDLDPLFEAFAELVAPPGWVIVSLLNPIHWRRLATSHWWQRALRAAGEPRVNLTQPYESYLHSVNDVVRAARRFRLVGRANAGAFVRYDAVPRRAPSLWWSDPTLDDRLMRRLAWHSPAHRVLGHFVFLVFRRDG